MAYSVLATSRTPALILYLLDVSGSMGQPLAGKRRIDVVLEALGAALRQMVYRSTKGTRVAPRYRVGMIAYSDHVYDLLNGITTVDQVARLGVPQLSTMQRTDTAKAFAYVENLLAHELPNMRECPAPLICHMTDGQYSEGDPEPIVRRIMQMSVPDGPVLVENIFISDQILANSTNDPHSWPGILPSTALVDQYAQKLRSISSTLPDGYHRLMQEAGYKLAQGALMMLPGENSELVKMGFVMSTATPTASAAAVNEE
jgi:hypothetical protein